MKADTIIHNCRQLLTFASGGRPLRGGGMQEIGIIRDGAVAIADGKILETGKSDEILRRFNAGAVLDAGGRVVAPGFVDPHTHIVYAGERLNEFEMRIKGADYLEILGAGGGIISTVEKTRSASAEDLLQGSFARLDRMLECGTTTAEVKTGYGLDAPTEIKMLGVIAELDRTSAADIIPTFLAAHAVPQEYRNNPSAYTQIVCNEMLPAAWEWYQESHLADKNTPFFADVFCERNAFSAADTRKILEAAKQLGFRLKAHTDEFTNLGGSQIAIELGAVSIDHLDEISPPEIELLAKSDTVAVVTPAVNFNSGSSRFADARRLIDSGCVVALSTDYNPGSAPCPSQPLAMAIACRYQKMLPAEAFAAATINAAYAIGCGDRVGSLEKGKQADVVIFDCRDFREVAYEFGGNLVRTLLKRGVVILDN